MTRSKTDITKITLLITIIQNFLINDELFDSMLIIKLFVGHDKLLIKHLNRKLTFVARIFAVFVIKTHLLVWRQFQFFAWLTLVVIDVYCGNVLNWNLIILDLKIISNQAFKIIQNKKSEYSCFEYRLDNSGSKMSNHHTLYVKRTIWTHIIITTTKSILLYK